MEVRKGTRETIQEEENGRLTGLLLYRHRI